MSVPPFRGKQVDVGGDWHGQLLLALDNAAQWTSVPEVRDAARKLRELLEQFDECEHSVSLSAEIPEGTDPVFVLDCVREQVKAEGGKAELVLPNSLRVEVTGRGSLDYVQSLVKERLSRGIAVAQFILSSKSSQPFRKG